MLREISRALSEYILLPGHIQTTPNKVDLSTYITSYRKGKQEPAFRVNIPVLSAAMQAVTGPDMTIGLAKLGGLGVIPCSQLIKSQYRMVEEVKRFKAGFVAPETVSPETSLEYIHERMEETGYSKFPVVDSEGKLEGIITDNDFDQELHLNRGLTARDRMIPIKSLDTAYIDEVGSDIREANLRLRESHHSVLPIIDREGRLLSLVFKKDWEMHEKYPNELLDAEKRYKVGAAINTHDYMNRVPLLIEAGADILFIDSSQGFTNYQKETLHDVKTRYHDIPIIGGNIVTREGFKFLVDNNADAVKVGMGSGSICITQEQIGVGRGQATAVKEVADERDRYFEETGTYIPIISDGGVVIAKDILIALALGADVVMTGRYLAGCDESPSEVEEIQTIDEIGRPVLSIRKRYWGEGSRRAKAWMEGRYEQTSFEEGVEGYVPYSGSLESHLGDALVRIKDGMRKAGCKDIEELHRNARLELLSPLAIREGRVHDVIRHGF